MSHTLGTDSDKVHGLAWNAFESATEVAKKEGLYGAGQDLLKDSFSGNVKGMGPGVAELEFEERPNEAFTVFAADKTDVTTASALQYTFSVQKCRIFAWFVITVYGFNSYCILCLISQLIWILVGFFSLVI